MTEPGKFQFWNYRDVRKEKFPLPKIIEVPEAGSVIKSKVEILLSHHYLIPLANTPKVIIDHFKAALTIENPDFKNYVKYGKGFVPKYVRPYITMYVMDSTYMGLPRSINFEQVIELYKKQGIEVELKDIRPNFEIIELKQKENFQPLYYQKDAIEKIVNENIVLKLWCGKGKTSLTILAMLQIGLRTLILVRTNLLVRQWFEEINKILDIDEKDIGIISEGKKTEGKITIATVQSLCLFSRQERERIAETYGHVICDEVHEAAAKRYFELLKMFKCKKITGLTATPIRSDGKSRILICYIGKIKKIDDGGIIPIKFDFVKTQFDFKYDARKNTYVEMIDALIENEERNKIIVDKIKHYLDKDKVIFVYSSRIRHLELLKANIDEQCPEIDTGLIVEKTSDGKKIKPEMQDVIRKKVDSKEIRVVFGTQIIKQGFNVRPLSCCIVATPAKSDILIPQIIGREQREYKGKEEVIFVDFIDEKIKTLLYQFFYKNKRFYKQFKEQSYDRRKELEVKTQQLSFNFQN